MLAIAVPCHDRAWAAGARRALGTLCAGLLLALLGVVPGAAAERHSPVRSEQAIAEAVRAGKVPDGADPRFVAAITTIDGLRGQVEFDAAGRLVGADLASDRISVTDAELARLSALPNLKRLRVSGAGVTRAGIDQISRMAKLTDLSLLNVQIDNDGLQRLAGLPQLAALTVHRSALVDDAGLAHLTRFPKLANLSLLEVNLTNQGVANLVRDLPSLRLLDLRNCAQVGNPGFEHLRGLKRLKVLRLGGYQVNDQSLAIVKDLRWLAGLTVQEAPITDAGLAHLSDLPLEELNLFRCYSLTDEGLRCLGGFPKLRQLMLRDLPITGAALAHLGAKPSLALVRLSETGVDDAGLAHLRGLAGIVRLELRQTQVTDAGLDVVGALANLEHLDLAANRITDAGVARLSGLTKLRVLDLTLNGDVTDAAVEHLVRLQALQALHLGQTGVSDEGVRRLARALPSCKIVR